MDTLNAALPDLSELDAFNLFKQQQENEGRKLKLSRFAFFTDALRVGGSVLPRIWSSVFWITLWSAVVAAGDIWYNKDWTAPSSVIGPLSFVVTLLVVYRNTSAFDRWYEGRKQFQDSISNVRSLSRFIWLNFDIHASISTSTSTSSGSESQKPTEEVSKRRLERKKRALRLLILFLVSTKHALREENGIDYQDYQGILPKEIKQMWFGSMSGSLRKKEIQKGKDKKKDDKSREEVGLRSRFNENENNSSKYGSLNSSNLASSSGNRSSQDLEANIDNEEIENENENENENEASPLDPSSKLSTNSFAELNSNLARLPISLPLLVLCELSKYFTGCKRSGMLDQLGPAGFNSLNASIAALTSELGSMERIVSTGIPVIYGIHLKQATLLYLLALPLTLVSELSWRMIPFVTLVSITLIGLEGIASEVESPFGYDNSDHPLDLFCASIRHEVEWLMISYKEGLKPRDDELE